MPKNVIFAVAIIGGIIGAIIGTFSILAYQAHKSNSEPAKVAIASPASSENITTSTTKTSADNSPVASHALAAEEPKPVIDSGYPPRAEWARAMALIAGLKLAISECLNDTAGDYIQCDEITESELGRYGVSSMPVLADGNLILGSVSLLNYSAGIQISGSTPLGGCVFEFSATIDQNSGIINWMPLAVGVNLDSAPSDQTVSSCKNFVRGA